MAIFDFLKDIPLSAVLREKLLAAEKAVASLDLENKNLKARATELEAKIRILEEQISERHDQRLEEVKEKILLLLSQHEALFPKQIATTVGVGEQVALHHLEVLQRAGIVRCSLRNKSWSLNPGGREYLVTHKLIA